MIHAVAEPEGRTALAFAVAGLPSFSDADVARYLTVLAQTRDAIPAFSSASGSCSAMMFLAPLYPALRTLSARDAARAWVLADMLCLDLEVSRRIEDDLVQRYAEDPAGEADWRGALTVDDCPACDTLWDEATRKYASLHGQWVKC